MENRPTQIIGDPIIDKGKGGKKLYLCDDDIWRTQVECAEIIGVTPGGFCTRVKELGVNNPAVFFPPKHTHIGSRLGELSGEHGVDHGLVEIKEEERSEAEQKRIDAINAFIPEAEQHANRVAGLEGSGWDREFHRKMNELARGAGLR